MKTINLWPAAFIHVFAVALCISSLLFMAGAASAIGDDDPPRISPFEGLRFEDETIPIVLVNGAWFECLAINDVKVADIMAHSQSLHAGRVQKRFGEDLPQLLTEMGHEPERTVMLRLRNIETDEVLTLADIEMTEANRRAIWEANIATLRKPMPPRVVNRIEREHAADIPDNFARLVRRMHDPQEGRMLTARAAMQDLDQLEWALLDQHSYLTLKGVDFRAALDAIRTGLKNGIRQEDFAIQLQKFIALLGDGHAGVRGLESALPAGCTDFLISDEGDRFVAFLEDRSNFLDGAHPFIRAINGIPMERWMAAASPYVVQGSPQTVRKRSARMLRHIVAIGQELDIEVTDHIDVLLESEDGLSTLHMRMLLRRDKPMYGPGEPTGSTLFEGDVAMIRIASMNGEAAREVVKAMNEVGHAGALMIDVRGNGGGTREVLRALFPYFMAPDEEPYVANVAKYRLSESFDRDHLEARFMHRANDPIWNDAQRNAIADFRKTFEPEWSPPTDLFSEWHYMVLDRSLNLKAFYHPGPVIIMMDSGCFSATDIFLGAFKGRENVTLMGTPSGGGSGRSRSIQLANSGMQIRLSSMASFQPDGSLYDGNGIQPDILIEKTPEDSIGRDSLFYAAFDHQLKLRSRD